MVYYTQFFFFSYTVLCNNFSFLIKKVKQQIKLIEIFKQSSVKMFKTSP